MHNGGDWGQKLGRNPLSKGQCGPGTAAQRAVGVPSLEMPKALDGALGSLSWWGATNPWQGHWKWVPFKFVFNLSHYMTLWFLWLGVIFYFFLFFNAVVCLKLQMSPILQGLKILMVNLCVYLHSCWLPTSTSSLYYFSYLFSATVFSKVC